MARTLIGQLEGHGFESYWARDGADVARHLGSSGRIDCVVVHLDEDGRTARKLMEGLAQLSHVDVVIMADRAEDIPELLGGDTEHRDVVLSTVPPELLAWRVESLLNARTSRRERAALAGPQESLDAALLWAGSALGLARRTLLERQLGSLHVPVLIVGPPGTPRSAVARWLHNHGGLGHRPFVRVQCADRAPHELAAELLGDPRGGHAGALRVAHGGTVLLDGIEHLPEPLQAELANVLTGRHATGRGSSSGLELRVVATSATSLSELVAEGRFRADLFNRLSVIAIDLSPLAARPQDIEPVARAMLEHVGTWETRAPRVLDDDALEALHHYLWPGNEAELLAILRRAVLLCEGPSLSLESLPSDFGGAQAGPGMGYAPGASGLPTLEEAEKQALKQALMVSEGNVSRAARQLGIGRATFYRKAKKYELTLR